MTETTQTTKTTEAGVVNFFGRLGPAIEELRWEAQRALSALDQKARMARHGTTQHDMTRWSASM